MPSDSSVGGGEGADRKRVSGLNREMLRFLLDEQQEGEARRNGRLSNDAGKCGWELDTCGGSIQRQGWSL